MPANMRGTVRFLFHALGWLMLSLIVVLGLFSWMQQIWLVVLIFPIICTIAICVIIAIGYIMCLADQDLYILGDY